MAGVGLAGLLAWAGVARGAAPQAQAPAIAPAHGDLVFHGMRIWNFKGSQLASRGSAERVEYERSTGQGAATRAEGTLSARTEGDRPVHLEAGTAAGRLGTREVEASNGVRLEREDGTVVTNSARYAGAQHLIAGNEPVEVTSAKFRVTGTSFTFDTQSEQIELFGPVNGKGRVAR